MTEKYTETHFPFASPLRILFSTRPRGAGRGAPWAAWTACTCSWPRAAAQEERPGEGPGGCQGIPP